MTIIRGGINAVSIVISYPIKPKMPKAHITPIITTNIEINVARKDRKNRKKIKVVSSIAEITKIPISSIIFFAFRVLM